jgi:hypothetical protein
VRDAAHVGIQSNTVISFTTTNNSDDVNEDILDDITIDGENYDNTIDTKAGTTEQISFSYEVHYSQSFFFLILLLSSLPMEQPTSHSLALSTEAFLYTEMMTFHSA